MLSACSATPTKATALDGEILDVQGTLYVIGARKGKPKVWMIASKDWSASNSNPAGMIDDVIAEYEGEDSALARGAKYSPTKIYGVLGSGDQLGVSGLQWVEGGSSFSGPVLKMTVLTGPYAGTVTEVYGVTISAKTGRQIEFGAPMVGDNAPPHALDPKYLKRQKQGEVEGDDAGGIGQNVD